MRDIELELWDGAAKEYDGHVRGNDTLRENVLDPVVFDALGEVGGKKILDAGCGQGYFANKLALAGARVSAVDGSEKLIGIGRHLYGEKPELSFFIHNLKEKFSFPDREFDIVLANMVLMDINPLGTTIKEFSRVLKPDGIFVFSILHPIFSSGNLKKSFYEKVFNKPPHYEMSRYKKEMALPWRIRGLSKPTNVFHRPLEFYAKLLKQNGFRITDIKEPVLDLTKRKPANNFMKLCAEIPLFLIVKAIS